MGVLERCAALATVLATAGCYSPEIRDCTLACSSEHDCAAGQVCGSDRLCAAPDLAGACGAASSPDGGPGDEPIDARPSPLPGDASVDAPPPDAPVRGTLTIRIDGKGHLRVDDHGTCDSDAPQNGMCGFVVPLDAVITVTAIADPDWRFDAWTTSTCPDASSSTCTFQPTLATPIGVKFRRGDAD